MYKITYYVLLFIIELVPFSLQACDYATDLGVSYRATENLKWNTEKLTGCISDASFGTKIIEELSLQCQDYSIPILEKNLITNMLSVRIISIGQCRIEVIEPGAFSNLPLLEILEINSNNFKDIYDGVFNVLPSLQNLNFINNRVSNIEDNAFANLPSLKEIWLDRNKLVQLRKEWFTNTSNIEDASFSINSIREIPAGMFNGWRKLKKLSLSSNEISELDDNLFQNGPRVMKYFSVHHNRLTSISAKTFSSVFIENLFLSGNLLNYLPEDFLNDIRVASLHIFANPFKCTCLEKMHKILLEKGVAVDKFNKNLSVCKRSDVPVCASPSDSAKVCVESVDKELTKKILNHMRDIRYDTVLDSFGQQCARFDVIE